MEKSAAVDLVHKNQHASSLKVLETSSKHYPCSPVTDHLNEW